MKTAFISLLILFGLCSESYAYLDPATGSIILQLFMAGFAGFFAYIIFYYRKFKNSLKNIFKKEEKKE